MLGGGGGHFVNILTISDNTIALPVGGVWVHVMFARNFHHFSKYSKFFDVGKGKIA
jgi:hypothetical protein